MGLVHGLKKIQPVVPDRKLALFKNLFYFLIPIDKDRAIAALGGDDLKGNILKHRGKMGTNSAALTEYDLGILIQQAEYELKGGNSEVHTKGPSLNDVRSFWKILDPPSPPCQMKSDLADPP